MGFVKENNTLFKNFQENRGFFVQFYQLQVLILKKKLQMDFDNLTTQYSISIYILQTFYLL